MEYYLELDGMIFAWAVTLSRLLRSWIQETIIDDISVVGIQEQQPKEV